MSHTASASYTKDTFLQEEKMKQTDALYNLPSNARRLKRYACALLVIYGILVLPLCGYFAFHFFGRTKLSLSPPSSSPISLADLFLKQFKNLDPTPIFILVTSQDGGKIVEEPHASLVNAFSQYVKNVSYSSLEYSRSIRGVQGYFITQQAFLRQKYVTKDGLKHNPCDLFSGTGR